MIANCQTIINPHPNPKVQRFRKDAPVAALAEFGLLERLLSEQCWNNGDDGTPVILKEGKETPSDSP